MFNWKVDASHLKSFFCPPCPLFAQVSHWELHLALRAAATGAFAADDRATSEPAPSKEESVETDSQFGGLLWCCLVQNSFGTMNAEAVLPVEAKGLLQYICSDISVHNPTSQRLITFISRTEVPQKCRSRSRTGYIVVYGNYNSIKPGLNE